MKREIQIHVAVTRMGDPFAINREMGKDTEICQFAAAFPAKFDGSLRRAAVSRVFDEFKETCLAKMRAAGMLEIGE
jgi:hypothetical protein